MNATLTYVGHVQQFHILLLNLLPLVLQLHDQNWQNPFVKALTEHAHECLLSMKSAAVACVNTASGLMKVLGSMFYLYFLLCVSKYHVVDLFNCMSETVKNKNEHSFSQRPADLFITYFESFN